MEEWTYETLPAPGFTHEPQQNIHLSPNTASFLSFLSFRSP